MVVQDLSSTQRYRPIFRCVGFSSCFLHCYHLIMIPIFFCLLFLLICSLFDLEVVGVSELVSLEAMLELDRYKELI